MVVQRRATALKRLMRILPVAAILLMICRATADPGAFKASIAVQTESQRLTIDGRLLLMDASRGHYPSRGTSLDIKVTPPLKAAPQIAWTASHGIEPFPGDSFAFGVRVFPAGAGVDRANTVGPFAITATLGPPVDEQLTVPGFAYESIALGCPSGFAGGYRIDASGIPRETDTVRASDIYVTDPTVGFYQERCPKAFWRQADAKPTLHIPGGAIDLDDERATFPNVNGSRWKGPISNVFDSSVLHGTLLWKTHDGRLMKTLQANAPDNLVGPTIMAGAEGRFPDNGWLESEKPEQRSLDATALTSLSYTTTVSSADSDVLQYGSQHPLVLARPYLNDTIFPHRSATVCLTTDPQVFPGPTVTWTLRDDGTSMSNRTAQLVSDPQPSNHAADLGDDVGSVLPGCQVIGNLEPGSLAITASVGAPVSRQVTRVASVYDTLVLTADRNNDAIRFIRDHAVYVGRQAESDLFVSSDAVLHFPGGGALFTDGTDPSLHAPKIARPGSVFSELASSAWHNDRTTLSLTDFQASTQPCLVTKANGFQVDESPCGIMAANILLFKTRYGRYVKLHIIDFFGNASIGAVFDVTDVSGRFHLAPADPPKFLKRDGCSRKAEPVFF